MLWFIAGVILMLILLLCGEWIAFAIGISGIVSLYPKMGMRVLPLIGNISWEMSTSFVLAAIPLFMFMGEIISSGGLTDRLYSGLSKTLRGFKGELIQTNIAACTFFAAASGSSVASAATMGRVAYPDMIRRGYDQSLVVGSIAAGGTLGILIPPSIIFILYGAMVEESVGKLFMAGLIPGLIMAAMFMVYIAIRAALQPHLVPGGKEETVTLRDRFAGLIGITPFLILIVIVLGSIYGGVATPTEAAAVGATGTLVLSAVYRRLTPRIIYDACLNTVRSTSMILLIAIAAKLMARLFQTAGANKFLLMELHSHQIQGFFDVPVDQLLAVDVFCDYLRQQDLSDYVIVAADVGEAKHLGRYANRLNLPMAIIDKRRMGNTDTVIPTHLIGDVEGKNALLIDDEVASAGTLCKAADFLKEKGAKSTRAAVVHPVLSGSALEKVNNSSLDELIVTNTIPLGDKAELCEKIKVLSVAPLFAKAIQRIHNGDSISVLF